MQVFNIVQLMEKYCSETNTWGMFLETQGSFSLKELKECIPYLDTDDLVYLACNQIVLLFETEGEMLECFNRTVTYKSTEDNPNKTKLKVHAITCNLKGRLQDENI